MPLTNFARDDDYGLTACFLSSPVKIVWQQGHAGLSEVINFNYHLSHLAIGAQLWQGSAFWVTA